MQGSLAQDLMCWNANKGKKERTGRLLEMHAHSREDVKLPLKSNSGQAHSIDHLVIPTRDYCLAPVFSDICQAVHFMHAPMLRIVSYYVQHKQMTPDEAYEHVRSIRPRVILAPAQWQAFHEYYLVRVKKAYKCSNISNQVLRAPWSKTSQDLVAFDDGSVVFVTESDLNGYDSSLVSKAVGTEIWADLSVVYRVAG
ncbi:hypothetical protein EZV62_024516 [Acer yangbiense]|uniref:Uncharacterized protein n=1 Tax=Acer yangbiense TaxID=1000413 RepID=A0A5C7GVI4_9ROSI|nr:hypothetical protein EZV62_024516 [Acer yangbiense]